ncbi:YraN family protein [Sorangium sp. So ce542]|uniref:YraN family protein n=1 Tax=Sorangium sp. So ce542 TaxID=3133316 RepID=UPI003F5F877B
MTGRRASRSPRRAPVDQAGAALPSSDGSGSHDGSPPRRPARASRTGEPPVRATRDGGLAGGARAAGAEERGDPGGASSRRAAIAPAAAPPADARRALGARAEDAVVAYLAARGMEVVARNARVGRLEIDVIARDGPVIAIIEVRTRGAGSYVRALDSIDAGKRARVRRAGEQLWRARFSRVRGVERMRFDAASVTFLPNGEAAVELIKAAF